jgi:hypothetical protein
MALHGVAWRNIRLHAGERWVRFSKWAAAAVRAPRDFGGDHSHFQLRGIRALYLFRRAALLS